MRRVGLGVALMSLSLAVLVVALVVAIRTARPAEPGDEVAFTRLAAMAATGQLSGVTLLSFDSRVVAETADGPVWAAFTSPDAAGERMSGALQGSGVEIYVEQQTHKQVAAFLAQFVLPLLLLANLFGLLFAAARSGGTRELLAFSKLHGSPEGQRAATFASVAGADRAVDELREIVDYLADPGRFERMGALPPKGVLLVGPPGCGKTLLVRAVAGEARAAFFSISGSEFVESLVGIGAARVRDLFRSALAAAPAVVFIDELDAVGRRRGAGIGGGHDEREQTLNELLTQLDGFHPSAGVIVLAASNRPDILDPALLRPGRFDRKVTVDLPDPAGREAILRLHAQGKPLAEEVDPGELARKTPGFSGADLANLLNEATLLAVRARQQWVGWPELLEATERVLAGPRMTAHRLSDDESRRIAFHEAGHALVAARRRGVASVEKVTIGARGRHIGHLQVLQRDDRSVIGRAALLEELEITMAGLAAEELTFEEPSTAGEGDLERATALARQIVARYGMSDTVGRVQVLEPEEEVFLGRDYLANQHVSASMLEAVDSEVRTLLDTAEAGARAVLQRNKARLERLATALLERQVVEGAELQALLTTKPARRKAAVTQVTRAAER